MNLIKSIGVLLLLASLPAAAARNTPHDPKKFTEHRSPEYFELLHDVKYTERRGLGYRWEQGLRAGTYEARYQDKDGVYFYGPDLAVCQVNPKCGEFDQDGGLWVSRTSSADIRLFIVQGTSTEAERKARVHRFGLLIDALAAADEGKIFIFPANAGFAGEMAKVRRVQSELATTHGGNDGMHAPDAGTLASIARDIELLKDQYPALQAFSAADNLDAEGLRIGYAYRTHPAPQSGGWTAGVPNPDDDGLWFHLDFHDPASTAQIHTQPMTGPPQCLGDKRVAFLILEGTKARSVNGAIWEVLRRHGIIECPSSP